MRVNKRRLLDEKVLNENLVYKNLRVILPKLNDYAGSETGYREELKELNDFGVFSNKQLRLLIKRHRKKLISIDRSQMDLVHRHMYKEEMPELYDYLERRNIWFAYPAFLRIALELEFGRKYEDYAAKRDMET